MVSLIYSNVILYPKQLNEQDSIVFSVSIPDLNIAFYMSEVVSEDWKTGKIQTFELSSSGDLFEIIKLQRITSNIRFKYNIGAKYEYVNEETSKFVIPTDNSLYAEISTKYSAGWKLDPSYTVNTNTQVTEAFKKVKEGYQRTSKFSDPITYQHTFGFIYNASQKMPERIDIGAGISIKQIKAEKYKLLTDDKKTKEYVENYKIESGIQFKTEVVKKLSENIEYKGKVEFLSTFDNLNSWVFNNENELQIKIWKIFGISIKLDFNYNDQIKPELFYKQNLKIGVITKI